MWKIKKTIKDIVYRSFLFGEGGGGGGPQSITFAKIFYSNATATFYQAKY